STTLLVVHESPTTKIYTLSLHVALPISWTTTSGCGTRTRNRVKSFSRPWLICTRAELSAPAPDVPAVTGRHRRVWPPGRRRPGGDRKSTRLNSSHGSISYAVFCLKKKKI